MQLLNILSVTKDLIDLFSRATRAHRERRVLAATFMDKIADCIEGIASSVAENGPPHRLASLCRELVVYMDNAGLSFYRVLPADQLRRVTRVIRGSLGIRQQWRTAQHVANAIESQKIDSALLELGEAIGLLRGTANMLRGPVSISAKRSRQLHQLRNRLTVRRS